MAQKQKVVIGGSTVTAGQLKDFFRKISDGTIGYLEMKRFFKIDLDPEPSISVSASQLNYLFEKINQKKVGFEEMKKFLEGQKSYGLRNLCNNVSAAKILGAEKMIYLQEAHRFWKVYYDHEKYGRSGDNVRYTEKTLHQSAEENKSGKRNWNLIYLTGLSVDAQVASCNASYFDISHNRWLDYPKNFALGSKPGYYLVNLNNMAIMGESYRVNMEILSQDPIHRPLTCNMFTEMVISLLKKDSNKKIFDLLKKDFNKKIFDLFPFHSSMSPYGNHLCIGFNPNGLLWPYDIGDVDDIHMYVYKEHEF